MKRQNRELEEKYEQISLKAKEEALEIIREVKAEAEIIIKEIREAQKKNANKKQQ